MTQTVQSIDKSLKTITTALKRCKVARDALVGFAGLGPSASQDAIAFSIKELTASAHALAEQARAFAEQTETIEHYMNDEADDRSNGQTAIND